MLSLDRRESRHAALLLFVFLTMLLSCNMACAQVEHGRASYYARSFTGRRTASGELFHSDSLTCAHRTLPFGTLIRVRNTGNNKEVIVRVNDRGPFVRGRIVDVSYAAAKQLEMIQQGVCSVEIEVISTPREYPLLPEEDTLFYPIPWEEILPPYGSLTVVTPLLRDSIDIKVK